MFGIKKKTIFGSARFEVVVSRSNLNADGKTAKNRRNGWNFIRHISEHVKSSYTFGRSTKIDLFLLSVLN